MNHHHNATPDSGWERRACDDQLCQIGGADYECNFACAALMCGVSCGEEAKNETNDQKLLVLCEDLEAKPKSIEVLLEAGADVETRSTNGCTPLIYAAWRNSNPEVIEALLKAGANSEVKDDDGKIALDYAMEYKNIQDQGVLEGQ